MKRVLSGEADGKLCIPVCARIWSFVDIYLGICRMFVIQRVHRRVYGLDFKKEGYGRLGKLMLDLSVS